MAAPQIGVTLVFTLSTAAPTQLSGGLSNRHGFLISNNDSANSAAVGLGTGNTATAKMHIVLAGNMFSMGESANASGSGPQAGPSCPVSDISAIAVNGTPQIAFTEW